MGPSRPIAIVAASCLFLAGAFLAVDRGGLLAWLGVALGALLGAKVLLRPASRDAVLALATLGLWAVAWVATWTYVRSTWESGEVVQLELAGGHVARVWVIDPSDGPVMYYDAPPDAASRLLAGTSLTMTRDGQARQECATAVRADELPEERLQELYGHMEDKYQGRNTATVVFYSVLGVQRDRVGLVIRLTPCR